MELNSQGIQESVNYINYSISDGLPSAETYDVFQDSKGYIWIGTDNGVVRYDGANFETFTTQDGLTDNTVFKIYEDYLGRIWFITYNRKLCYLWNNKITPYSFNKNLNITTENIGVSNTITEFSVNKNKEVHISFVSILSRVTPQIEIDSLGICHSLPPEKDPDLFLELQLIENLQKLFHAFSEEYAQKPNHWNKLIQTKHFGRIRVFKLDTLFYFGTENGLYTFSSPANKIIRHVLINAFITSITVDFEGGLWCSSLYNGIFYIASPNISTFKLLDASRSHINGIIPQKNEYVFCYYGRADNFIFNANQSLLLPYTEPLQIYDVDSSNLARGFKLENTIFVKEVYADFNSVLKINDSCTFLASSTFGLIDISRVKWNKKETNRKIGTSPNYDGFKFWTEDGRIYKTWEKDFVQTEKPFETKTPRILRLFRFSETKVLLATLEGLYELDLPSKEIQKSNLLGNNNSTRIQDIIRTPDHTLLFATKGNGIIGLKEGTQFQIDIQTNGETNAINQLLLDTEGNRIFVATNFGVYELFQNHQKWDYRAILSKNDCLALTDIRQIRIKNNILFYANNKGVGKVDLETIKQSFIPPFLTIKSLQTQQRSYDLTQPITIPFDSNTFDISFQAIGYKSQNKFIYSFRLNPQYSWRTSRNSTLTFNSLEPGEYHLELSAINVQGVQSVIQHLKFTILAPYWQSWWFIGLCLILILSIITWSVFKIISFYQKQAAIQRKINELQMLSLQSKMSPHFIFNSLNSIQNYILTNNKMKANEYLIDFSRLIRSILKNAENSSILLSKEMEILEMYVELEKKRLRKPFGYTVELIGDIDLSQCEIPCLLIQPYVENSIWHGQVYRNPEGEIKVRIERINELLTIQISDNGIGIKKTLSFKKDSKSGHKSMGAKITKNRIELVAELHSQMSEVSTQETHPEAIKTGFVGTSIQFSIPYLLQQD